MNSDAPTFRRFLLFAMRGYYPSGGWDDFQRDFDTLDEAKRWYAKECKSYDWGHIVDLETRELHYL